MSEHKRRKQGADERPLRGPTSAEARAIVAATTSLAERPGRASVNISVKDGTRELSNPHSDGDGWATALQDAFASSSLHFTNDSILKLHRILDQCGGSGSEPINAALALIGGIAPQDELQTAIAIQIVVNHAASIQMMDIAIRNANAGHFEAAAAYTGMGTKIGRTMMANAETLAKLRGGGRQVIEHRYINVNAANAVLGDNTQSVFGLAHAQGAISENDHQPRDKLAIAHAPLAPVLCAEQGRGPVPVAGDEGAQAVSPTRRQEPRRARRHGKR